MFLMFRLSRFIRRAGSNWPDLVDQLVVWGGVVGSVCAASWSENQNFPADWGWTAFGAFSTMSGFVLAALAMVVGASSTTEDLAKRYGSFWNALLEALIVALWCWSVAALAGLALVIAPDSCGVKSVFGFTSGLAVAWGTRAQYWITIVLLRFRRGAAPGPGGGQS